MFTGIIQGMGSVHSIQPMPDGKRISINLSDIETSLIRIGDSIAVNGACLTVTRLDQGVGYFDVSKETLSKCLVDQWQLKENVNLELALTLQTPIGGHLVSGHVDGIAKLKSITTNSAFTLMSFETSPQIGQFIATKGSVALNGVSLTTNKVVDNEFICEFEVTLVPHTLRMTSLGQLQALSQVHVEVDQIARYIHRMLEAQK